MTEPDPVLEYFVETVKAEMKFQAELDALLLAAIDDMEIEPVQLGKYTEKGHYFSVRYPA